MMGSLEALIAIALLCQLPGARPTHHSEDHQLRCQKWYIHCLEKAVEHTPKRWTGPLKDCVLERPANTLTKRADKKLKKKNRK